MSAIRPVESFISPPCQEVAQLFKVYIVAINLGDTPIIWKLQLEYVRKLSKWLRLPFTYSPNIEKLPKDYKCLFLGLGIDLTTGVRSYLLCKNNSYYTDLIPEVSNPGA